MHGFSLRALRTLSAAAALAAIAPMAANAASIKGVVKLDGAAPKRTVIKMDADPNCAKIHGDKKVGSEDAIVSKEGLVKNAFVYIKTGLEGKKFDAPATPGEIDQSGCMYTPHVSGIMVGQTLNIKNSDPTLHNIHCLAKVNQEFNMAQPQPGVKEKSFRKAESPIKFKCDVHPWMSAYVHVMEHPFFAVSEKDGTYTIKDVPAGKYTVEVWHETLGTVTADVEVGAADATADLTLKAK